MSDGIDALEQMVEWLTTDLQLAKDRAAIAESGRSVLQANVVALHDTVRELRDIAEARLEELAKWAYECGQLTVENMQLRAEVLKGSDPTWFARLNFVTAQRDGLLKAAESAMKLLPRHSAMDCECHECRAFDRLMGAVAACAPEVKP